jgi:hypothetical protein
VLYAHSFDAEYTKALVYCHATSFSSPSQHRAIKVSTHAVLFFGTPHSGANGVELAQWLGRLSSVHMYTSRAVLKDLGRDSPELESIQQSYLHASDDVKTIFFYEEYRTPIQWWFSEMVSRSKLRIFWPVDRQIDRAAAFGHDTRGAECRGGCLACGSY